MTTPTRDALPQGRAHLFRNGRSQAVRIQRDLELPGTEVIIHKQDNRLIVEPAKPRSRLLDVLATLEPVVNEFPDTDRGLPPLDDVDIDFGAPQSSGARRVAQAEDL